MDRYSYRRSGAFFDRVLTTKTNIPNELEGIPGIVFGGVAKGGDGFIIVGGKIIRIPPRGPKFALLQSMIALDATEQIDHLMRVHLVNEVAGTIAGIAKDLVKQQQ